MNTTSLRLAADRQREHRPALLESRLHETVENHRQGGLWPHDVWSMDSRAGAVSEVEEASVISVSGKSAGHSNPRTTLGYVHDDGVNESRLLANARRKMRESRNAWNRLDSRTEEKTNAIDRLNWSG